MDAHPTGVITDDRWIDDVLAGDQAACGAVVQKYQTLAYNVAWGILKHDEEAEKADQDAFIKAYRNLDKFDRRSKFSTRLYRIVANEALSRARKRKHTQVDIQEARYVGVQQGDLSENPQLVQI